LATSFERASLLGIVILIAILAIMHCIIDSRAHQHRIQDLIQDLIQDMRHRSRCP
jgi:hypothetical protein